MSEDHSNFDPYKVLNLKPDATQTQIKSAYRKLALKYHPDRQKTEEDKILYKDKFLEVSRSYELLGDPKLKEQYDKYGIIPNGSEDPPNRRNTRDPFGGFPGGSFMNFVHEQGGFMDPFDLFDRMFHDDLRSSHREDFRSSFQSPFGSPFGFHSGFGSFFDGFGGGMNHMSMMNDMMNMHNRGSSSFGSNGQGMSSSYYSSSTSSFGRGSGGVQESVSTSTRIINGKRQTVTERVKVHADGTVERSTETSGDKDFPAMLENEDDTFSSKHRLLQDGTATTKEIPKDHSNNNQETKEPSHKKQRFFSRRKDTTGKNEGSSRK